VTAGYSGSTLTDYDVLIEIDTASLIAAGKMQADCDDLRVTDSDMTTLLDYWIEGGCNTGSTQVWARMPSMRMAVRVCMCTMATQQPATR
jgi:hypothetical protein